MPLGINQDSNSCSSKPSPWLKTMMAPFLAARLPYIPPMQEDEGEEDTDFTPMSQDGGSRRTFSIDSILPNRAVDPRPLRSSRLGTTPSSRPRERSSKLMTCLAWSQPASQCSAGCLWVSHGDHLSPCTMAIR